MIIENYDYILFLFYALLFFSLTSRVLRKRATPTEYKWFMTGWSLKMVACLAYTLIIVYYYGYGDTLVYYKLGDVLHNAVVSDFTNFAYFFRDADVFKQVAPFFTKNTDLYQSFDYYNNSNFVIHKMSCVVSFFTFNRFLLNSLVFTNFAFWGYVLTYKALKRIFPSAPKQIAFVSFFIPSCIFWSCGLVKEPVCILAEGIIIYYIVDYLKTKTIRLKNLLYTLLACYVLYTVKNYIMFCLFTGILLWLVYYFVQSLFAKQPIIKFAFGFLLFFVIAGEAFLLWSSIQAIMRDNIGDIIATNASIYKNTYEYQSGGSLIEVGNIDRSDAGSVLSFLPKGLVNVMFRPWPWEISNPLMVLTVLENLFLSFLFVKTLLATRFFTRGVAMNMSFQVFALTFSISLALIIGISTFNFGTLVRYRIPLLPFWVLFLMLKSGGQQVFALKPRRKYVKPGLQPALKS